MSTQLQGEKDKAVQTLNGSGQPVVASGHSQSRGLSPRAPSPVASPIERSGGLHHRASHCCPSFRAIPKRGKHDG